jgi:hypothetical protein
MNRIIALIIEDVEMYGNATTVVAYFSSVAGSEVS